MRLNLPPGWPTPPQGWRPDPSWEPDPSWPPAPDGWQLWVHEESGDATQDASREHRLNAPSRDAERRRWLPLVVSLAVVVAAVIGVGYVVRENTADDIVATIELWADTWGGTGDLVARDALTCAKDQGWAKARPRDAGSGTDYVSMVEVRTVSVGLGLDTGYATARLAQWESDQLFPRDDQSNEYGFEMVKEFGSWKVCAWGSDAERNRRTLLWGWKISGSPE